MRWLYYIPHLWEDPDGTPRETSTWEDLYLMPDIPLCKKSIWLTVDAYRAEDTKPFPDSNYIYQKTWFDEGEFAIFEKQVFLIRPETNDMIVKVLEFTKKELLEWVELFLKEMGHEVTELVEAPEERFAGSNQHACAVEDASEMLEEYKKDPEGHSVPMSDFPVE